MLMLCYFILFYSTLRVVSPLDRGLHEGDVVEAREVVDELEHRELCDQRVLEFQLGAGILTLRQDLRSISKGYSRTRCSVSQLGISPYKIFSQSVRDIPVQDVQSVS